MKRVLLILVFAGLSMAMTTTKQPYQLFNAKGKTTDYQKMLKTLAKADVVLFGEEHNNAVAHWLQLELTKDLHKQKQNQLVLGAEMFEADNQLIINEYLTGLVPPDKIKEARLWNNFETDYRPLLDYAKANELPFVATNIPRRYASVVYKKGGFEALNTLSDEARQYIAPLPVEYDPELSTYKQMVKGMPMGMAMHGKVNLEDLPKAQAIKDATMAHFIVENHSEGQLFLHFNGRGHSDFYEGIVWYLKKYAPELKVATISTRKQADISQLDEEASEIADFVLVVDQDMTDTY